jgi:hypothetical protein
MSGQGLVRFGVPASAASLRWGDFLDRNPMPVELRDAMTRRGNLCLLRIPFAAV